MKLPLRSRTRSQRRYDRATVGLAVAAMATAGTVLAGHVVRMARRRLHTPEVPDHTVLGATSHATVDSATVLAAGYDAGPHHEKVLFNLLTGFVFTFGFVRVSTAGIRGGWWPFGNVSVGGRHIHHFVPGILLAFGSGIASLVTDNEHLEAALAVPFGAGLGLTFDEAALLLDLEDVYWTREGLLSVQVSLGVAAILGATILGLRILDRGERRAEREDLIPHPA
jgi:hypothetical protein